MKTLRCLLVLILLATLSLPAMAAGDAIVDLTITFGQSARTAT